MRIRIADPLRILILLENVNNYPHFQPSYYPHLTRDADPHQGRYANPHQGRIADPLRTLIKVAMRIRIADPLRILILLENVNNYPHFQSSY